jgi:branched-chain amino acid transport system substrate-binding protein
MRNKKMKKLLTLVMVSTMVLLVVLAGGCGEKEPEQAVLKIGCPNPLSGAAAGWGIPTERAVKLAAADINAAGGIEADGKIYTIEIISADTQLAVSPGTTAMNKLVYTDKVKYIVGPTSSNVLAVTQEICEANGVITFFIGTATPKTTDYYTFRCCQTGDMYIPAAFASFVKVFPNTEKIAVVHSNSPIGQDLMVTGVAAAEAAGLEVVAEEYVETEETDFYPTLTKILANDPDMIDIGASVSPGTGALMLKQAKEMGFSGAWVYDGSADFEVLKEVAGIENAEGVLFPGAADYISMATTPLMVEVGERYLETYGTQDAFSLEYYNAVLYIKQAIEEAGTVDTSEVVEVMRSPGFTMVGIYGSVEFVGEELYGTNSVLSTPLPFTQIVNGEQKVIALVTWEEMKPLVAAVLELKSD